MPYTSPWKDLYLESDQNRNFFQFTPPEDADRLYFRSVVVLCINKEVGGTGHRTKKSLKHCVTPSSNNFSLAVQNKAKRYWNMLMLSLVFVTRQAVKHCMKLHHAVQHNL